MLPSGFAVRVFSNSYASRSIFGHGRRANRLNTGHHERRPAPKAGGVFRFREDAVTNLPTTAWAESDVHASNALAAPRRVGAAVIAKAIQDTEAGSLKERAWFSGQVRSD